MTKKYLVEFTHQTGEKEQVELVTDKIEWSINQWCRNRAIVKHEIIATINEYTNNDNKMLFG
jgi:hypothetical protein|tara:strand:+ start:582 stop:767 length:186 start_codon:yes stop_codon:yes gene_type:complete